MTIDDLSNEQQSLIEKVKNGENVLVDACIGSGKTTTIQMLCNEFPDKKILYLTYNTLLKADAKQKITAKNVTVTNYHGFAFMCLKRARINAGISDLIQTFNKVRPNIPTYDLLVLDEYQDIEEEIGEMLNQIKEKNSNLQIVAVGDMMQKIYDKTTLNVPEFIKDFLENYTLMQFTKCFRLSDEHAKKLGKIWEKEIHGVNEECVVEKMKLEDVVSFLSDKEPGDILCLGSRTGDMSKTLNKLEKKYPEKFNKTTVYASISDNDRGNISPTKDTAIFTTFDSAKGMERKYCLVFDYTEEYWSLRSGYPMVKYEILRNIFLVAASRGKSKIIFVKGNGHKLRDKTIAKPFSTKNEFNNPFFISEMFDFKYKEDIEHCYEFIKKKKIKEPGEVLINRKEADGYIDLSPCIGIYQEAIFFKNYDIDKEIEYVENHHSNRPKMCIPEDASLSQKILYLTAFNTQHDRYVKQVELPFINEEEKNQIKNRLKTVFTGDEPEQCGCYIKVSDGTNDYEIEGKCDVIKNNKIYELKFVSELTHEHFLQLAVYMVIMGYEKGRLWNVKNNEMWEIQINKPKKFMNAVLKTITKGVAKKIK